MWGVFMCPINEFDAHCLRYKACGNLEVCLVRVRKTGLGS